jgi:hypothetical protein
MFLPSDEAQLIIFENTEIKIVYYETGIALPGNLIKNILLCL